jgi:TRAP-type transport system periplasmic protein
LIGKAWQDADEHGRNDAKEKGQAIETPAPAEFEKWKALLQVVTDDWIKKVDQKGYDGRKLLDDLQAMIKQASS